jgi:hypothetical protein
LSRSLESLQLSARGAVKHLPPAGPQTFANRIGGGEVAVAPALDTLGDEGFGF